MDSLESILKSYKGGVFDEKKLKAHLAGKTYHLTREDIIHFVRRTLDEGAQLKEDEKLKAKPMFRILYNDILSAMENTKGYNQSINGQTIREYFDERFDGSLTDISIDFSDEVNFFAANFQMRAKALHAEYDRLNDMKKTFADMKMRDEKLPGWCSHYMGNALQSIANSQFFSKIYSAANSSQSPL